MKRFILLATFGLATATLMPASAGNLFASKKSQADTVAVKLANGAKMMLFVKNTQQLQAFQSYSLDSLMRTLDKYISDAEQKQKNMDGKDYTVSYNPAVDTKNPKAPEKITISFKESDKAPVKQFKIEVNYDDKEQKTKMFVGVKTDSSSIKKVCKPSRTSNTLSIGLGFNALTQTDDNILGINDLRPWGARFVNLGWMLQTRIGGTKSPLNLRTGLNFMFYNYMFDDNIRVKSAPVSGNKYTYFVEDTTVTLDKSKLAVTTINVPFMAILDFKNDKNKTSFRIGAGGFIGYRLGAHTKVKFEEEGHDRKDKDKGNFNLEDFQYGLNGLIGYRCFNLFANYNLNELFKDNRGPKANTLSFGISWDI